MAKSTIRAIAEKMGVSPSTVSRALGNDAGVGEVRRNEIRKIAEEMGYKPKPFRRKRTQSVGLILTTSNAGTTKSEFLRGVVFHIEREASKRNIHIHLAFVKENSGEIPSVVDEGRVDGVVLAGFPDEELCEAVKKSKIPAVVLHDRASRTKLHSVFLNSEPALRNILNSLLKSGHENIALVLANRGEPGVEQRYMAYTQFLRKTGKELKDELTPTAESDSFGGGIEIADNYIKSKDLPDAIIFENDWMALGAMYRFAQAGIRVPDDVSIVGHDNTGIGMESKPAITTIDSSLNPTSELAFDLLEKQLSGKIKDTTELVLEAQLMWRDSCPKNN